VRPYHPLLLRLVSALSLLLAWQLAAWWWASSLLPTPAAVIGLILRDTLAGGLLHDLGATLRRVGLAFVIAMLVGSVIFDVTGILAYSLAFILVMLAIEYGLLQPLERAANRWRR